MILVMRVERTPLEIVPVGAHTGNYLFTPPEAFGICFVYPDMETAKRYYPDGPFVEVAETKEAK